MATNRIPARRAQRVKINDENANAQGPVLTKAKLPPGGAQRVPVATKPATLSGATQRAALGEVTQNLRKENNLPAKPSQTSVLKRARSTSLAAALPAQRPQPNPANRQSTKAARVPVPSSRPSSRIIVHDEKDDADMKEEELGWSEHNGMDIDDAHEVEEVVGGGVTTIRSHSPAPSSVPPASSPGDLTETTERAWPAPPSPTSQAELARIREEFVDEVDDYDPTMVSEYADDIFAYMAELEEQTMPGERYVEGQGEITWEMRQTLVDWLLQVHLRYRLLPETLWIAVNIVDRFLTKRVVSLVKLQLVGVTAMFIAAKYEEIMAPSVEEFVFMTENGYQRDEILKGERIILQTLDFRVSSYCTPYSWIRRISKADDYDLQTRTLSKFLMEVTLLDYRFLRVKPSMIAAIGMYSARKMLGGDWNEAFVYYSGFTESQLQHGHDLLVDKLSSADFENQYVYKKYLHKRFLKASSFARDWALRATGVVQ